MSEKISVGDFIKNYTREENVKLCIPLIQRNYKWLANVKKENGNLYESSERGRRNTAHNLIFEIIDNCRNEKKMTLGIVVLYDYTENDDITKRFILDGQQRIITLSLIVRYLIKENENLEDEWFDFTFERDFNNKSRYNYLFNKKECEAVDVQRMKANYDEIKKVIKEWYSKANDNEKESKLTENEYKTKLLSYIKNNICFIVRKTTTQPLDEFLNVNSHKTPFSICDYVKAILINDILTSDTGRKKEEILELYKKIAGYLYSQKDGKDNELFKMISKGYTNIESGSVNRMDLIFEDKYNPFPKKETKKIEQTDVMDIYNEFDEEINRIEYFCNVLKGMEEELYTKDSNNKNHLNSNVFNSFYALYNLFKNEDIKNKKDPNQVIRGFFSLFKDEDIKNKKDPNQVISEFCWKKYVEEKTGEFKNINAFIDSVMHYEIKTDAAPDSKIGVNNKEIFEPVNKLFFDIYRNEYIDIIKKGKEINLKKENNNKSEEAEKNDSLKKTEKSLELKNGEYSIKQLLGGENVNGSENVNQIVIPSLQRDYIQGCNAGNFIDDILIKNAEKLVEESFKDIKEKDSYSNEIDQLAEKIKDFYADDEYDKDDSYYKTYADEMIKNIIISYMIQDNNYDYISNIRSVTYRADDSRKALKAFAKKQYLYKNNVSNYRIKKKLEAMFNYAKEIYKDIIKDNLPNLIKPERTYTASCIVGYLDSDKNLNIYDGQQRIVTFLCAIGYLKRYKEHEQYLDDLYKKFVFEGRPDANKALEILYKNDSSDEKLLGKLLGKLSELICDQTTDAIYKLVKMLHDEYHKKNKIIPYQYFYDNMAVEYYGIDEADESTQLFMDLNSGCKLTDSEIYKAEFMHYLTEFIKENKNEENKQKIEEIEKIQEKLDNSFINIFAKEGEEAEEKEIAVLKDLIQITYVERFHSKKWGDFPKELQNIKDEVFELEFLKKLKIYMEKYEDNLKYEHDYRPIYENDLKFGYDYNPKYKNIYNDYYFQDKGNGEVCLYCNYDFLENQFNKKMPLELKLKIIYDLSTKGYIKLKDWKSGYNLDLEACEKDFDNLLKNMSNKDFRDDLDNAISELIYTTCCDNTGLSLNAQDKESNLLSQLLETDFSKNVLEHLFFDNSINLSLEDYLKNNRKELLNKELEKKKIYEILADNYDIVRIKEEYYYYSENKKYTLLEDKKYTLLEDYDIEICKEELKKLEESDNAIKEQKSIPRTIGKDKLPFLILLLLDKKIITIGNSDIMYNKDNIYYLKNNGYNYTSQFLYKGDIICMKLEGKIYYYCNGILKEENND